VSARTIASLTDGHANLLEGLISSLLGQLVTAWAGFDRWHDTDLVAGQAARSAQLVTVALPAVRQQSRAYHTAVLRELGTKPGKLPAISSDYPRANITPFEVYQRPATAYAYAGSRGLTAYEAAVDARARLAVLAESDLRSANRDEAQRVYTATPQVIGYRRIIHPELSTTGTCGLCVVASQRMYKTSELLPLHFPSCHCESMAVVKGDDPGMKLNDDDLATVYAAAGGTAADQLRETRIRFTDHGELGPVLVKDGDHFTTAKDLDLARWKKPDKASVAASRATELEQVTAAYTAARAAADAFDVEVPAATRDAAQRQRAYVLQRAWADLAARSRALRATT
jgi:hypothetical protein